MTRTFVFIWLAAIGTNFAGYYSDRLPLQTLAVLAGGGFVATLYNRQLLSILRFKDFLFAGWLLVMPIVYMLLSSASYDRGTYTSQFVVIIIFAVAAIFASRPGLDRPFILAVFATTCIASLLNVFELLAGNIWSVTPGRSAGFYINPNYSSEAVLGYGLLFLSSRVGKLKAADLVIVVLVVVGVFATFSRTGIITSVILLTTGIVMRAQARHIPRIVGGAILISILASSFIYYVFHNVALSGDATQRIESLVEGGGVGDYQRDRGLLVLEWMEVYWEHPIVGGGVGTIFEGTDGPHNMFIAMMVDYGAIGLIFYVALIVRLLVLSRRGESHLSRFLLLYAGWMVLFSFASHNLLGNAATIVLLAVAVGRAYRIQQTMRAGLSP
jgi:hypothetical protein